MTAELFATDVVIIPKKKPLLDELTIKAKITQNIIKPKKKPLIQEKKESNQTIKPEIKPNIIFGIKANFFFISVFSFIKKILKARKYRTILKNNTNDFVCKFAEITVPTITPITTNKP